MVFPFFFSSDFVSHLFPITSKRSGSAGYLGLGPEFGAGSLGVHRAYLVTLKFAEIYWSSANRRIFNVKVGGQEVIRNLDLFAKVGKNRAYDVAIPVSVNDGVLRIEFVSIKDNAKISAILVRKAQ